MFDKSRVKYAPETDTYSYVGEIEDSDEFVKYVKELGGETMDKKFTEEQYQKIVEAFDEQLMYENTAIAVMKYLVNIDMRFMAEEALAIANPKTRELAHDKYVENEKKYYWTSKKQDKKGYAIRIMMDRDGLVRGYPISDPSKHEEDEKVTESKIREWGFNPDMFKGK